MTGARSGGRSREGDVVALTPRELQVLALVAAGEPSQAISTRLGIRESTIKAHLTNIYAKTGARNRVQATRYYLANHDDRPEAG